MFVRRFNDKVVAGLVCVLLVGWFSGCGKSDDPGYISKKELKKLKKKLEKATKNVDYDDVLKAVEPEFLGFLKATREKDYEAAYRSLHEELQKQWEYKLFAEQMEYVRKSVGEWDPQRTSWYVQPSPKGQLVNASYRLEKDWKSKYTFSFAALKDKSGIKVYQIAVTVPELKLNDADNQLYKEVILKFLQAVKGDDFEMAQSFLTDDAKNQISIQLLSMVREYFKDEDLSKDIIDGESGSLIDGKWFVQASAIMMKKIGSVTFYLAKDGNKFKVASLYFRGKVSD